MILGLEDKVALRIGFCFQWLIIGFSDGSLFYVSKPCADIRLLTRVHLVLKILIAAVYTNFTTTIIDDEGIEQRDFHLAGPVGDKLILQFDPAFDA